MNRNSFAVVNSNNTVTLPADVAERLGLKAGDRLDFGTCGNCTTLTRMPSREDLEKWAQDILTDYGDEIDGVSVRDRSILVRANGDSETAYCHPNDDYSFTIGVAVALCKVKCIALPYGLNGR